MKTIFTRILTLAVLAFAPVAFGDSGSKSFVSSQPQSQPTIVDTWGKVGDISSATSLGTDVLTGALRGALTSGKTVDAVTQALGKLGLSEGGKLAVGAKIAEGLGNAVTVIDGVVQSVKAVFLSYDAAQRGDRAAYQKAVADYIITMTSKIAGVATATALTGGTAGLGTVLGIGAGIAVDFALQKILDFLARGIIEDLAGKWWDLFNGQDNPSAGDNGDGPGTGANNGTGDSGGGGPFDGLPDGDTNGNSSKGHYQGLKPIRLK